MRNRGVYRNCQRCRFRRGAQPQIDAQNIAIGVARLKQIDDITRDPHRCLARIVTRPPRHCLRIEQQNRVDVRTVIQFAAAVFAQRNRKESLRHRVGDTHLQGFGDNGIERIVRKIGKLGDHILKRQSTRQIADRQRQSQRIASPPQSLTNAVAAHRQRKCQTLGNLTCTQHFGQQRIARHRRVQKRGICRRSIHRIFAG